MTTVYLDGQYLPIEQARVPVLDRGFLFGDGVYEVIPVYDRRPFRLDGHLTRLCASLEGIRLVDPLDATRWREVIDVIVAAAEWDDLGVYIQVTRGPGPRDHAFPQQVHPTVLIMPLPLPLPSPQAVAHGVAAITAADTRWARCDLKTIALLPNVLLRQLSVDAGCAETILLRDGWLTEGSASSVLVVIDGVILAPPPSTLILPGVTHDVVLELAGAHGMACAHRAISESALRGADEIWLASSTKEILAVTRLDGLPVGSGEPGPVYRRLHALYQTFKHEVMRGGGAA